MTTLEEIEIGDQLPALEKHPSPSQLFRYSAITWNPHRIHYDAEHARKEGHPHILVQAHMHGAIIQKLIMDWIGSDGELTDLAWRNVGRATPEDTLYAEAEVTSINEDTQMIEFEAWTRTDDDRCAEGTATAVMTNN